MNPKQKKPAHAPKKKNMLVNKYTETQKPEKPPKPDIVKELQLVKNPPPVKDPPPVEQMEITIAPQGMRQVRKLAQEVHDTRVENRRQFLNIEELLDERDHQLFEELSELIAKNQSELHAENRKLRASIEELLGVVDRHLLTWFRTLTERMQQQAERDGEWMRQNLETRLAQHERNVTALLNRLEASIENAVEESEEEEQTFFKLGDRINVFAGDTQIDGTGAFITMNDEVLIWFDSTAQVR
ncbi:MAG: hypothetical protein ACXVC1_09425, partial [Tumebacillaceae bacterium]